MRTDEKEMNKPHKPAWKKVTSGRYIDLNDFKPDDVDIDDIIISLERQARFDGHGEREPLNVLQHSLLVYSLLRLAGCNEPTMLIGLIHDAHEAYLGDIGAPVQKHLGITTESEIRDIVRSALVPADLVYDEQAVKDADIIALNIERRCMWNETNSNEEDRYWPKPRPDLDLSECKELFDSHKNMNKCCFLPVFTALFNSIKDD